MSSVNLYQETICRCFHGEDGVSLSVHGDKCKMPPEHCDYNVSWIFAVCFPHLVTSKTWIICEYMRWMPPKRFPSWKLWFSPQSFLDEYKVWKLVANTQTRCWLGEKIWGKRWPTFAICTGISEIDTSEIRKNIHKISIREVL